jgi:hypothetical protein
MNISILRTLASLALSAALSPVSLLAQGQIHINVPFDFTVGSKSFAAGEYNVRKATPQILHLQSADGHSAMLIPTTPVDGTKIPGNAEFKFNRYGDRYFLAQVSSNSGGWRVPKSAVEKELIAKMAAPKPLVVVASGGKK